MSLLHQTIYVSGRFMGAMYQNKAIPARASNNTRIRWRLVFQSSKGSTKRQNSTITMDMKMG